MTTLLRTTLAAALALAFAGCHGPKSTPEASVESYMDAWGSKDIKGMLRLTMPASVKKAGGEEAVLQGFNELTYGIQSFDYRVGTVSRTGKTGQAQVLYNYVWRIRGQNPETFSDQYEAFYLEEIDGKWYIDIPGLKKVSPY